jgi:alpha-tubulin suppressor-like RCC1 family protein
MIKSYDKDKHVDIEFIACGTDHMLAISRYDHNPLSGRTYAWGKNQKGQLGIGSKENNMYEPMEIKNAKERFKKVACGHNYSIGLSQSGRVYHWGNYKFLCNNKVKSDVEEPIIITSLENFNVFDIACCYKTCMAYTDKEEIKIWGKYLLEKGNKVASGGEKDNVGEETNKSYFV